VHNFSGVGAYIQPTRFIPFSWNTFFLPPPATQIRSPQGYVYYTKDFFWRNIDNQLFQPELAYFWLG
jgi:hypothetical protein